jgi:inner membrane protein
VATSSHLLLDYLNTYGVRPFLPFDGTWFYGDALFIIDPIFDVVLMAVLAAGHFLSSRRRQLAVAGLIAVALYVGLRLELRNEARSYLADSPKAAVSPLLNPFRWIGLIDSPDAVSVVVINPLQGVVGDQDRISKAPADGIVTQAALSRAATVFREFARFPVVNVQQRPPGYAVTFFDVRYFNGDSAFGAKVLLDGSLQIVNDSLSFTQPLD